MFCPFESQQFFNFVLLLDFFFWSIDHKRKVSSKGCLQLPNFVQLQKKKKQKKNCQISVSSSSRQPTHYNRRMLDYYFLNFHMNFVYSADLVKMSLHGQSPLQLHKKIGKKKTQKKRSTIPKCVCSQTPDILYPCILCCALCSMQHA